MNFTNYDNLAARTIPDYGTRVQGLDLAALGLGGEAGEFVDMVKKHLYHGADFDPAAAEKELGDILWYLSLAARVIGTDLQRVAMRNIEKLKARYPDGFAEGGGNR